MSHEKGDGRFMQAKDEIIFTGAYKDFSLGLRFGLSGRKPDEVAAALSYVSQSIEPHAFRFSGLKAEKIDAFVRPSGNGLEAACNFLESLTPGAIKEALAKALPEPALMPVAETYFFGRLLGRCGIPFKADSAAAPKPEKEEIGDFIGFIGKYGEWIAIKKLGLENVQDYEVSAILAGINHTAVNKGFDFSQAGKDDPLASSAASGKRKSFGNAALSLRALAPKLRGGANDAYAVCKTLEAVGYKPYASPEMLSDAHPDIKPPKVRGRKPKG